MKNFKHKAKKSLGQNFLKNKSVIFDILKVADVNTSDVVLEIGPGKGILTEELLFRAKKVIAIEKDDALYENLENIFSEEIRDKRLDLIHGDVLEKDFSELKEYKLVANIPYNITGEIIRKFLSSENKPKSITLLIQKEVAERIVARDGKESILSISVKVYGEPKYVKKVGARNFKPEPKVDSAILHIANVSNKFFLEDDKKYDEKTFFTLIKTGFSYKRKKLFSNLKSIIGGDLVEIFKELGLNSNIRAEKLEINDWKQLFDYCVDKNLLN